MLKKMFNSIFVSIIEVTSRRENGLINFHFPSIECYCCFWMSIFVICASQKVFRRCRFTILHFRLWIYCITNAFLHAKNLCCFPFSRSLPLSIPTIYSAVFPFQTTTTFSGISDQQKSNRKWVAVDIHGEIEIWWRGRVNFKCLCFLIEFTA